MLSGHFICDVEENPETGVCRALHQLEMVSVWIAAFPSQREQKVVQTKIHALKRDSSDGSFPQTDQNIRRLFNLILKRESWKLR